VPTRVCSLVWGASKKTAGKPSDACWGQVPRTTPDLGWQHTWGLGSDKGVQQLQEGVLEMRISYKLLVPYSTNSTYLGCGGHASRLNCTKLQSA
jgi:hypothetical protein